jgi:hypothetical protein
MKFATIGLLSGCLSLLALPVSGQNPSQVQGWTILSSNYDGAITTLDAAKSYNINHLQLCDQLVMNLCQVKNQKKRTLLNDLIARGHKAGIKEVVIWDHALYQLEYYPDKFKTGPKGTIDFDNPAFWEWFKQDYRDSMKLIPDVDGLVLTFIETGARAETQYSKKLTTGKEKLAAVVDAVASVVCDELGKQLYIRTFAYNDAEYQNTIGCIAHIRSNKVRLMMKEVPHDFFLTHPNDKYAGTIDRPTLIEFDEGNEYNGQGVIANTWPDYVIRRWSDFMRRPHIIGYVARTDRHGDTHIVGTPNEILLLALKRYTADQTVTADQIYDEFITAKYGPKAVENLKPAFKLAYDIVTSSLYTLGTNTANHSRMGIDPSKSNYGRHVSGKWIDPPVVYIKHGVNKEFHYWTDVIDHMAPAAYKVSAGSLAIEAPIVLQNKWVTPEEKMNETYLKYIMTEKHYGAVKADEALNLVMNAKSVLKEDDYHQIYNLFYRTLLTAKLYDATATSYFGYRVYARGEKFQTEWLKKTMQNSLAAMLPAIAEIENYKEKVPRGQWNWFGDTATAKEYFQKIAKKGWPEYGNVVFPYQPEK